MNTQSFLCLQIIQWRLLQRKNPHLVRFRFLKVIVKQILKHQKIPLITKVSVVSKELSHDISNISPTIITCPYQRINRSTYRKEVESFLSLTMHEGIHLNNPPVEIKSTQQRVWIWKYFHKSQTIESHLETLDCYPMERGIIIYKSAS